MAETPKESDRKKLKIFLKCFIYADIALATLLLILYSAGWLGWSVRSPFEAKLVYTFKHFILNIFKLFVFLTACIAFFYYKFYHKIENITETPEDSGQNKAVGLWASWLKDFLRTVIIIELVLGVLLFSIPLLVPEDDYLARGNLLTLVLYPLGITTVVWFIASFVAFFNSKTRWMGFLPFISLIPAFFLAMLFVKMIGGIRG